MQEKRVPGGQGRQQHRFQRFPAEQTERDGSAVNGLRRLTAGWWTQRGAAGLVGSFTDAHWLCGLGITHQEHKKNPPAFIRRRNSVETFVRKIVLPHIDLKAKAPYRLQRQVAGSGFPNHS